MCSDNLCLPTRSVLSVMVRLSVVQTLSVRQHQNDPLQFVTLSVVRTVTAQEEASTFSHCTVAVYVVFPMARTTQQVRQCSGGRRQSTRQDVPCFLSWSSPQQPGTLGHPAAVKRC